MESWRELPLVKPVLEARLQDLSTSFSEYVEVFRHRGPFSAPQLSAHLKALRARAVFPSAAEAVSDSKFADDLRAVLGSWRMGTRGTELVPVDAFRAELGKLIPKLAGLEQVQIDDVALDGPSTARKIWN
jgi:hypothetical protein